MYSLPNTQKLLGHYSADELIVICPVTSCYHSVHRQCLFSISWAWIGAIHMNCLNICQYFIGELQFLASDIIF